MYPKFQISWLIVIKEIQGFFISIYSIRITRMKLTKQFIKECAKNNSARKISTYKYTLLYLQEQAKKTIYGYLGGQHRQRPIKVYPLFYYRQTREIVYWSGAPHLLLHLLVKMFSRLYTNVVRSYKKTFSSIHPTNISTGT